VARHVNLNGRSMGVAWSGDKVYVTVAAKEDRGALRGGAGRCAVWNV
jgi:hypothetical protein